MTDIQHWPVLIEQKTIPMGYYKRDRGWVQDLDQLITYTMVPLTEYQMGNLLGLLKRSGDKDNGDWFWEFVNIIRAACQKLGVAELRSNFGDVFDMTCDLASQVRNNGLR